ncbi:hypothetical protein D3C76_1704200 [compost metagenome]
MHLIQSHRRGTTQHVQGLQKPLLAHIADVPAIFSPLGCRQPFKIQPDNPGKSINLSVGKTAGPHYQECAFRWVQRR